MPPASGSGLTLVSNYPGTGIGDFGVELTERLRSAGAVFEILETHPNAKRDERRVQRRAVESGIGPIVSNLGLTAWGDSGAANLLGFRAIGRRARENDRSIAIVHHAIELIEPSDAGYPIRPWTRWGAHRALSYLRPCRPIVFTPTLAELLKVDYGWTDPWVTPLPCRTPHAPPERESSAAPVATIGYLAKYKGLDLFLEAAERSADPRRWSIIGAPHKVLSESGRLDADLTRWTGRAQSLGVSLPGFRSAAELDSTLVWGSVGVLSYTSTSGASASFGQFAERAIPVVATDLPEFRYLLNCGAGVMIVPPDAEAISEAVRRLQSDPARWRALSVKQGEFAVRYSWTRFISSMVGYLSDGKWPGSAGAISRPVDSASSPGLSVPSAKGGSVP